MKLLHVFSSTNTFFFCVVIIKSKILMKEIPWIKDSLLQISEKVCYLAES